MQVRLACVTAVHEGARIVRSAFDVAGASAVRKSGALERQFEGAVETFRVPPDPDPLKTFSVTFSEDISYRAVVQARDAATAKTLVQNQLSDGGVDSLEETHHARSDLEVEEVCS